MESALLKVCKVKNKKTFEYREGIDKQLVELKNEIDYLRLERHKILEVERKEVRNIISSEIKKLKEFVENSMKEIDNETSKEIYRIHHEGKKVGRKIDEIATKKVQKKTAQTLKTIGKQAERQLKDTVQRQIERETFKIRDDLVEAEKRAVTDSLTGAYNRRYFMPRLKMEVTVAGKVGDKISLLMLDIDNFKKINDTYGHPAGDSVLREISMKLHEGLRKEDILGRYGGEEFVIFLPQIIKKEAVKTAERLRRSIKRHPFYWEGESFNLTISLGVAAFPEDSEDYIRLIEVADERLLKAKREGKDRVIGK